MQIAYTKDTKETKNFVVRPPPVNFIAPAARACDFSGMVRFFRMTAGVFLVAVSTVIVRPQSTERLTIFRSSGPKKLQLEGELGREYMIEGCTDLSVTAQWQLLLKAILTKNPLELEDLNSATLPRRFYRFSKLSAASDTPVKDFRLIDQYGKSRELQYYFNQ